MSKEKHSAIAETDKEKNSEYLIARSSDKYSTKGISRMSLFKHTLLCTLMCLFSFYNEQYNGRAPYIKQTLDNCP